MLIVHWMVGQPPTSPQAEEFVHGRCTPIFRAPEATGGRFSAGEIHINWGLELGKWWENMGENWENHINEGLMRKIIKLNGWFSIAMFEYQRVMVGTWLEQSSSRLGYEEFMELRSFFGMICMLHMFFLTRDLEGMCLGKLGFQA